MLTPEFAARGRWRIDRAAHIRFTTIRHEAHGYCNRSSIIICDGTELRSTLYKLCCFHQRNSNMVLQIGITIKKMKLVQFFVIDDSL